MLLLITSAWNRLSNSKTYLLIIFKLKIYVNVYEITWYKSEYVRYFSFLLIIVTVVKWKERSNMVQKKFI